MDKYYHFEVQELDVLTVVHLVDRRVSLIAELHDELNEFVTAERPARLLINFGCVAHCSSELISALLDVRSLLLSGGGKLKICGLREEIRQVFQVLRLDGKIFEIHDSASTAIAEFGS